MWQLLLAEIINGIVLGSIYGLIAVAYTMVWRVLAFINFAHGEVYMFGAFGALTFTWLGLPLPLAALGGIAVGALTGVVMEKLAYKPLRQAPKINLLISAIGVSIFLQNAALLIWGPVPQPLRSPLTGPKIQLGIMRLNYHQLLIIFLTIAITILLELFVKRTIMGKAMRAAAEDMETAGLMGININRVISTTFAVGSAVGALAGILTGALFFVYPTMGALAGLKGFTASVLGGMGNLRGAFVGGLVLAISENIAAGFISSGYRDAIAMVILLVVLLFRPSGLFGHAYVTKQMQRV